MVNLTRASQELFNRAPDERHESLQSLWEHCHRSKLASEDKWRPPQELSARPGGGGLVLSAGDDGSYALNDWSFTQLCKLAGVSKDTVNRLTPETAGLVLGETMPAGNKPLQLFATGQSIRSIHGVSYTRLYNSDLLSVVREYAVDFQPPQKGLNGGTGLYCGEQDMFCFLIDPTGWTDIGGESFAPGFYLWNSEVGKRSLGISTFWFQAVCANHIIWDAVEVVEFTRKHTANIHESLGDIRHAIEALVEKRDARKDSFAELIRRAMETKLGDDADEVLKVLGEKGVGRTLARRAVEIAGRQQRFTLWCVVDALTKLAGEQANAGERTEADVRAAELLQIAA